MLVDQGGSKVLPLQSVYDLLENSGFVTEAAVLRDAIPGGEVFKHRAKRGMALEILRSKGLLDKFIPELWPNGATEDGMKRIGRYEKAYQEWRNQEGPEQEEEEGGKPDADSFA